MRKVLVMAATAVVSLVAVSAASAATVVVTPSNTHGWYSDDTRPGGAINYVNDSSAPGNGALQLTTDATTTSKAQYMHDSTTALADVGELSYSTKQNSASFAQGDPSYQLGTCLGGVVGTSCVGFTTFVYEPYENGPPAVLPGTWQSWDVAGGQMWSSRSYSDGGSCTVVAGGGGAPFYTLAGIQAACPNAVVAKFGVNIGSNNPSYDVESDLVNFDGTTYDFEPYAVAGDKGDCKDGGWKDVKRNDGSKFKNQGDCIQYVNTGK